MIDGTIEFAGTAGGASKMSKVAVSQGTAAAPAIYVSGTSGLELSDAVAISRDGFAKTASRSRSSLRAGTA